MEALKEGQRVKVISVPVVDNNEYGQLQINRTINRTGTIRRVYENGIRNVYVTFSAFGYNYYSPENLEVLPNPLQQ